MHKDLVYENAKERYEWEHERKNALNNMVTIPMGVISIMMGFVVYIFSNLPERTVTPVYVGFYIFLICACIFLALSFILFYKHQTGYTYVYIANPEALLKFEQKYINNFNEAKEEVDYGKINIEISKILRKQYVESTAQNIQNNEKKILYYRFLIITVMLSILFFTSAFIFRRFLPDNASDIVRIETVSPLEISVPESVFLETSKLHITANDNIIIEDSKYQEIMKNGE